MKKVKLLVISSILCTSLLGSGLFSNSVQASSKNNTTKIIADATTTIETVVSDVDVLPTDSDGIRTQFNNFISVTGSSDTAYNMSKLLADILPDVSYINFRVTNTHASIFIHKNSTDSLVGEGIVGINYDYNKNYVTYFIQNPTEFSADSNKKMLIDLFYNEENKLTMIDDATFSLYMINRYISIYKNDIIKSRLEKTSKVFVDKSALSNYGGFGYFLKTENDGKIYFQIMIVKIPE